MPRFEIAVYNTQVVEAVNRGEHHKRLDDGWAETRYVEITAPSANEAHLRAAAKYPATSGFVVQSITPLE